MSRGFVHLREGIDSFLRFARGKLWSESSQREKLQALSVAVRRPALDAMRDSERRYREQDAKRLYYLSMEFLMGRTLGNMLMNLGIYDEARNVIAELNESARHTRFRCRGRRTHLQNPCTRKQDPML